MSTSITSRAVSSKPAGAFDTVLASGLSVSFPRLDKSDAIAITRRVYGIDGAATRFSTEKDDTFRIDASDGARYVLKVSNPGETAEELDLQVAAMRHVAMVAPQLPVPRVAPSIDGQFVVPLVSPTQPHRTVRLYSYLEGTPLDALHPSVVNPYEIGEVLAKLQLAMASFRHPHEHRVLAWDVKHFKNLTSLQAHIADPLQRSLIDEAFARFAAIEPALRCCPTQVVHNDFNRSNIVANPGGPNFVSGIIDFGDTVHTAIAIDVATAVMNQFPLDFDADGPHDLFVQARDLLRGYLAHTQLSADELLLIPHLAMARVAARALLTSWRAMLFPENEAYILRFTRPGWEHLRWFMQRDHDTVSNALLDLVRRPTHVTSLDPSMSTISTSQPSVLKEAVDISQPNASLRGDMPNGFNPSTLSHLDAVTQQHIARRLRLLGPSYRLFYAEPVKIVRGEKVYLYDDQGNDYLDAYNNVVCVGHANPRIVDAIARQLSTLCTHTRYMQEPILDYAEDLLSTFGTSIGEGQMMFTCTGSEANDLAMRIAMHYTGKTGVIVTSEAYHGNSHLTSSFSPSLGRKALLGPYVRTVPAPDSYRMAPSDIGHRMAEQVALQIEDIRRHGGGLAAFIADSFFSSDGVFAYPTDVLGPVAEVVRRAGGLFIADEVQSGFGRSGTHMWGHERHGVVPDIVTLGKPMGNGYPVAGLVVRPEIVAGFGQDMRYFNTFGGNSVAIAAAQATLDVLREEHVLENAQRVGAIMLEGLNGLARKYECIGDVRGTGLYFGVEMVRDRAKKDTDIATALKVVNGLRQRRVLISATGPDASVLKIRPPLVFTANDADRLLTQLDAVLAAL
jgi:4-aminobutyrate aminotransferase-like enzyme/Ser/Thr protein kinase RdoA (MazF antagonist)